MSFIDPRDNREYRTMKIGKQIWLAENLNYNAESSKYYDNNLANCQRYGRLYNWETAKNVCPLGWHLPSKDEWQTLINIVGGDRVAGRVLKARSGWKFGRGNMGGNGMDNHGFTALPGGYGNYDVLGKSCYFGDVDYFGYWWSASEKNNANAYRLAMISTKSDTVWDDYDKGNLFSVRCLKD